MLEATAQRNGELTLLQPARQANIDAIAAHLRAGAKPACRALGIELEHICVNAQGRPLAYSEPGGVRDVLRALSSDYPQTTVHDGDLLGVARPGMAVTIEPAAQLELSAGPFESMADALCAFQDFEADVARALEPVGGRVLTLGYDSAMRAVDKELIPKARYEFMDRYLSAVSPWGPRMMRGSASTQVSIDYVDETDCMAKMRAAQTLAPLFALMCDNSPVFEGAPRPHALMRTEIWNGVDPDRCGAVPGMFEDGFGFEDYAAYLLDVPAIVAVDADGKTRYDTRTFGEIYADRAMTDDDVLHAMSMVFPDVRLKSYVEIRPADSMPVRYAVAYAALVKGLFYNENSFAAVRRLLEGASAADVAAAKTALMKQAYEAQVYGHPVAELADAVIDLARNGLSAGERPYLDPLAQLVAARETLADRAAAN